MNDFEIVEDVISAYERRESLKFEDCRAILCLAKEIKSIKEDQIRILDLASVISGCHAKTEFILNEIKEMKGFK